MHRCDHAERYADDDRESQRVDRELERDRQAGEDHVDDRLAREQRAAEIAGGEVAGPSGELREQRLVEPVLDAGGLDLGRRRTFAGEFGGEIAREPEQTEPDDRYRDGDQDSDDEPGQDDLQHL